MSMFRFGGQRQRARVELEKALQSIDQRLDTLEISSEPAVTRESLKQGLEHVLNRLGERFEAVDARIDRLEASRTELLQRVKDLTFAVEEGIQRVSRTEQRIHGTIKRARKELAKLGYEDPGLEAEAGELRLVNGGGSEESEVPTLPTGVEPPIDEASSVKGVSAAALRQVRGF